MRLARPRTNLPLLFVAAALLVAAAAACSDAPPQQQQQQHAPATDSSTARTAGDTTFDGSLLQALRQEQRFSRFTTLIDSAGLAPALRRGGPYTVFAVPNAGLDRLPRGTVEELLRPQNRARLRSVLGYHLHPGTLTGKDLRGADSLSTLTRRALPVAAAEDARVRRIGTAMLETKPLTASNGRLYPLDRLLLPPLGSGPADIPVVKSPADTTSAAPTATPDTTASDSSVSDSSVSDSSVSDSEGSSYGKGEAQK